MQARDALAKPSAEKLVALLTATTTGPKRLKGLLPPGTPIAHKTGTSETTDGMTAATNDVGIITLPGNAGHVVVAAFLTTAHADNAAREHALAVVGSAVFDHYAKR